MRPMLCGCLNLLNLNIVDNDYLQEHLLKYIRLCAKKEEKESCFCDIIDGKFVFGYEKDGRQVINRVTKQIAIGLTMGLNYYLIFAKQSVKREEPVNSKQIKRRRIK